MKPTDVNFLKGKSKSLWQVYLLIDFNEEGIKQRKINLNKKKKLFFA